MNQATNQTDIFTAEPPEQNQQQMIGKYPQGFQVPDHCLIFCGQCGRVPKLCKCLVTKQQARIFEIELHNLLSKVRTT